MRYFYDTEFLEDGKTIDLISIGIVREDGEVYYAVNSDVDWPRVQKSEWLMQNVAPSLPLSGMANLNRWLSAPSNVHPRPSIEYVTLDLTSVQVKPKWVIANEVREFLLADGEPELWGWYSSYDHVVLCQLFGRMIDLPSGMPMFTHDLKQVVHDAPLPKQASGSHNALADAQHLKASWEYVRDNYTEMPL